ncbi:hypothetical protein H0I23_02840 [Cellulophaga sp. HaHaR_3_176]|uniref:hypothetical protein n=1 Tax=Cellulophaga sp. HaHaR_3_176 TaxID=1942464 RepID=UPI001C1FA96D|nr:hypothetical protein [Cellulophaga sp. HaHaR_3_176]QWX84600.1 hypothetical protein H0I23_02840 [Cellulophaga sp. HaHaR_3_176]
MKKILGAILISLLISCNSTQKKENKLLKKEAELYEKENEFIDRELELTKKEQKIQELVKIESIKKINGYIFNDFHISQNRVGIFSKGMTISDLYNTLPKEQIKKIVSYGEFADDSFDAYEIYDSYGKKILILQAEESGNTNSKINYISILDNRFMTTEKIGLNSTFDDFGNFYSTEDISPVKEHIFLNVEHLNATFSIKKTELKDDWWDGKGIDQSKIPKTAKFDNISIWFN